MSRFAVGPLADLPQGAATPVEFDGIAIAVVPTAEGVFAIEDRCSHARIKLSLGEVHGCFIECWKHGAEFDLRTGQPQSLPATEPVRTFPVSIELVDGTPTVFVEIG